MRLPSRVVVLNDSSIARGGATGLALLSVRLMRARGIPVTFITGDAGQNPELEALGVEVVALGGRQLMQRARLNAATAGIYNRPAGRLVADWIAANDTPGTSYHLHGWSKILSPAVFVALRAVAPRTVLHAHDFFLACPNGAYMDYRRMQPCARVPLDVSCLLTHCDKRSYAQKLWRAARQAGLRAMLAKAAPWAAVVMIHERMAPYLVRAGLPPHLLRALRNPAEPFVRERIRVEANAIFYFVGRVEAEKGIEDALAAAAEAGVRMRVIGDGPLRSLLAAQYPDVDFLGWRSREEIAELVTDARALVMPTRYPEPFGLVAAEASQSGLPVVLSRTAFLGDQIAENGLGFVCDVRDRTAFAATLRTLAAMPSDEIRGMSERGFRRDVRLATTPDEWIGHLIDLYRTTAAAPRAAA